MNKTVLYAIIGLVTLLAFPNFGPGTLVVALLVGWWVSRNDVNAPKMPAIPLPRRLRRKKDKGDISVEAVEEQSSDAETVEAVEIPAGAVRINRRGATSIEPVSLAGKPDDFLYIRWTDDRTPHTDLSLVLDDLGSLYGGVVASDVPFIDPRTGARDRIDHIVATRSGQVIAISDLTEANGVIAWHTLPTGRTIVHVDNTTLYPSALVATEALGIEAGAIVVSDSASFDDSGHPAGVHLARLTNATATLENLFSSTATEGGNDRLVGVVDALANQYAL